jgi:hypothetical protein
MNTPRFAGLFLLSSLLTAAWACSSSDEATGPNGATAGASSGASGQGGLAAGGAGHGGTNSGGLSGGGQSGSGLAGKGNAGQGAAGSGQSGSGPGGSGPGGSGQAGQGQAGSGQAGSGQGGAGGGFWETGDIPAAKNVMVFKFLNRTGGKFADSEVYWRFEHDTIHELHSIAELSTYDMPANSSGRMYFFLCAAGDATCQSDPSKSDYYDFIEHTIGADQYNGNTTRVDAFGLKIAMRLHCADGFERTVGEDEATFAESREATFAAFLADAPAEFAASAQPPFAPYRIVQPGAAGFDAGGAHEHYYDSFVDELWSQNGLQIAKPGPNGSGLGSFPDVSAALYRHVGATPGTFDPMGKLLTKDLWKDASTFYQQAPADYYARFWHKRGIDGKAYGFPYDDVGGYSTYVSHKNPQYMLVAIGF